MLAAALVQVAPWIVAVTLICSPAGSDAAKIAPSTSLNQCLDVVDGKSVSSTRVQLWACNSNAQQDWSYTNGYLTSLQMCLQPVAGIASNGAGIEIASCSGSAAQQWIRNGTMWMTGKYCLDLTNGVASNGALPQLWQCYDNNSNQRWIYPAQQTTPSTTSVRPGFQGPTSTPSRSSSSTTTTSKQTTLSTKTTALTPASGTPVSIASNPSMCLDTVGSSTANGVGISLAPCSGSSTQSWLFSQGVISILGGSKCLDVPSGSQGLGTLLQLWDCYPGNTNQQWTRLGSALIFGDSLCLDVPNGNVANGQQLQLYTCANGNQNQQWSWQISASSISNGVASQASIRPIGRMYPGKINLAAPQTLSWPASGIMATFTGSSQIVVALAMQNYPTFKVYIDNVLRQSILSVADMVPITGLDKSASHTILLVKTNEADYGTASFEGFIINAGGVFKTPPSALPRRIEVLGDSFTTGFGNLGAVSTCAAGPQNEDSTLAYASITAAALNAELSLIASEGWGMYSDYLGNTAHAIPAIYGDATFLDDSNPWDFSSWLADVVVINLGSNDLYQASSDNGAHFLAAYTAFLATVRSKYGASTWIFCTAPHVQSDASTLLNTAVQAIVSNRRNQGDGRIRYVDIATPLYEPSTLTGLGCQQHPNIASHAAIAQILIAAIRNATHW